MVQTLEDFGGLLLQENCLLVGYRMEFFIHVFQSIPAILTTRLQNLGCILSILIISVKQWNFEADYFLTFTLCSTNRAQLGARSSGPSSTISSMTIVFMTSMRPSCLGHTSSFRPSSTHWRKLPPSRFTSQQAAAGTSGVKAEKRSKGDQP